MSLPQLPFAHGTEFRTDADISVVNEAIAEFLRQLPADVEKQADHAIHAVYYSHQAETKFSIKLYSAGEQIRASGTSSTSSVVVVFDRGQGCSFGYIDVIRAAKYYFPHLKDTSKLKPLASLKMSPPPVDTPCLDKREVVGNLLTTALKSTLWDVKEQFLIVLADLSSKEDTQDEIARRLSDFPDFVSLIQTDVTARHRFETVQRCAVAILANVLPRHIDELLPMFPDLGEKIQTLCLGTETQQVLRECGRVLEVICTKIEMRPEVVAKFLGHADPSIQRYGASISVRV